MTTFLTPTWVIGSIDLTYEPFLVDRDSTVDIGEPEMVVETATSMLADGDIERVVRHGNRDYVIEFYIEGPTLGDIADSEALLRAEIQRPDLELTHNPGDGFSATSVYQVLTAKLKPGRKDDHESHFIRQYTLTLRCMPFARSLEKVVVPALVAPVTPDSVVVDTCDSATGWTADVDGTPATVDMAWSPGAVSVHELLNPAPQALGLKRTGSVNFATHRYLVAEVGYNDSFGSIPVTVQATVGGSVVTLTRLSQRMLSPGWFEVTFDTAGTTVSALNFFGYFSQPYADLKIREVRRSNQPPGQSVRQQTRILTAGGTERTPASIHVASTNPSAGLGMTIVHTSPEDGSGYSPPLRRWRVSGNGTPTPASDTFSGAYEPIHADAVVFEVPNSAVPKGEYGLCAALKTDTIGTHVINWSAQTRLPGVASGTAPFEGSKAVQFFTTTDWHFVSLTPLSLPTMQGNDGAVVRIAIQFQGSQPPTIILDDAWLFRLDDGSALTVTNSTPQHLWIDSPGVASGSPEVAFSALEDRSDAWHPGVSLFSMGTHMLNPDGTSLFSATRDFDNAAASAEFYRHWHSNAAS